MQQTLVFSLEGALLEVNRTQPTPPLTVFQQRHGAGIALHPDPAGELIPEGAPLDQINAVMENGQVVSVAVNPGWTPPEPAPDAFDELKASLAQLQAAVNGSLTVSEHDKRWLEQKEAAKRLGIPWIKANPACTQAEVEAALSTLLATEFSGDPLVISPAGVILSYAKAAQSRGYIATADFAALRDLVAATSEKDLTKLLAKL